ncbi:MAG: hypothetical protein FJ135_11710 [Deltaproteobacteria bacterium]|nr:hypothetical protein [Deltaproteobacteria bacterium]
MTEKQSPRFRWWPKAVAALGVVFCLGLLAGWYVTTASFWQRVGWRLVAAVQDRVDGEVSVKGIAGNLVTGMVFHDLKISRPSGDIIRAKQLEVSLSLTSFFRLQPVIRTLIFREPEVFLHQDEGGAWNVAHLLKKRPPPPFAAIHLPGIRVEGGRVQVDRPQQQLTLQDIGLRLNLTIQAPGRPQLAILVHQGSFGVTAPPYPPFEADLALTYSPEGIFLKKAQVALAGSPVLFARGRLADLSASPLLNLDLTVPELSGPRLHQIWPRWPRELSFLASLETRGPLTDLQINGQGALQGCTWQLQGAWRHLAAAAPTVNLALKFQKLTAAVLRAWLPRGDFLDDLTALTGVLSLSTVGHPWASDTLQARLDLEPFSHRQARFEAGTLVFKQERPGRQHLALNTRGNFGRLETEAVGQLIPWTGPGTSVAGEITLASSSLNPVLLLGPQAPPGALDLKFAGDFRLPSFSQWPQARLAGKLQATGKIRELSVQEVSAQGTWEGKELQLTTARLDLGNLKAEVQGRLAAASADMKLAVELSPPGPWPLLPADLKGQGRVAGTLQGSWQSLVYNLEVQGTNLSWRRVGMATLQGKAAGTVSKDSFSLSNFDILAQKLSTPAGVITHIQGLGQTRDDHLVFDIKARHSQTSSGSLTGTASWQKNATRIKVAGFRWDFGKDQIRTVEAVTLNLAPGSFEISPLRLKFQESLLSLVGRGSREEVSLSLKAEKVNLQEVARVWPQASFLHGVITAQTDIQGSPRSPLIKGHFTLAPGRIARFHFDSFQTEWLYQGNVLSVNGRWVEKPDKAHLAWQGSSPLTLSLYPWSWQVPETGLQARLWSDNLNLSLFSVLIPGVAASEGPLALQVQVGGSMLHPSFSGALRYGAGTLTIRESGAPLALVPGEIHLEGTRLLVPRLVFHSGDGQGEITGGASLEGLRLQDVQLSLVARDLLAIRREGSRAVAHGQVGLTGSWPAFRAEGRLLVNDAQFRSGFFRSEKHKEIVLLPRVCQVPADGDAAGSTVWQLEKNFGVNLVIDLPEGVWLRDKEVRAELQGQIRVRREPPGPRYLGGSVRVKHGGFALNNKMFTVERATLDFPDAPNKPSVLDARASRQVDDYTLFVAAYGPVDALRTRVESSPPLPPRDILSLLVFDHLADKMTREEYITATQKAMGILGTLTAQKLKSLLGDELPLLGEVSPTTSQEALGVGKKLGKDITVSYERRLNPVQGEDVNQIRLDYRIRKYLSAETQIGRKNTGGDIFLNFDF